MKIARQTTNILQHTTYSTGGPAYLGASRGRTDCRLMESAFNQKYKQAVRRVARAPSPGLWYCSEDGTDRPWRGASKASNHTLRTPKARADEAPPRQTWQPVSCCGKTTYKTTHKTMQVYRPGHGAGTPPDMPFGSLRNDSIPDHLCSQQHGVRTSSGLCRSLCLGSSISIDDIYLFSPFNYVRLQTQSPFDSIDFSLGWYAVRSRSSCRLASCISGSDTSMEEKGCHSWTERLGRPHVVHFGDFHGSAQLAVEDKCRHCVRGSFPEDSSGVFLFQVPRLLSARLEINSFSASSLFHYERVGVLCSRVRPNHLGTVYFVSLAGVCNRSKPIQ